MNVGDAGAGPRSDYGRAAATRRRQGVQEGAVVIRRIVQREREPKGGGEGAVTVVGGRVQRDSTGSHGRVMHTCSRDQ